MNSDRIIMDPMARRILMSKEKSPGQYGEETLKKFFRKCKSSAQGNPSISKLARMVNSDLRKCDEKCSPPDGEIDIACPVKVNSGQSYGSGGT
jgi:hypothetical protein